MPAPARFPWRLAVLGLLGFGLYLVAGHWQPPLPRSSYPLYVAWFSLQFLIYVAAVLEIRRSTAAPHPLLLPLIIGWAVIFRLSLLWVTPGFLSDDIYRYVWDGLVQRAGMNPYWYPPEAPQLAFLRDHIIFPMINRPWGRTIYPPGAQLFFHLVAWIRPGSLIVMKGAILLADVATITLLLRLCQELDIDRALVILYAWHPLVIAELGISGHLDGLMIPSILLAFVWTIKDQRWLAGMALGAATLIKLYPAILLPVLVRKRAWRPAVSFTAVVGLGYLLYLDAGRHIIGYLPDYMAPDESYNLSLRPVLGWIFAFVMKDPYRTVQWVGAAVLLIVMWCCVRRRDTSPREIVYWGVGLIAVYLLLVSPSVFQWYLLWLLALLTLAPTWSSPAWLYWSWSVNLGYIGALPVFEAADRWLRLVEYGPVFLWLGGWWVWTRFTTPAGELSKGESAGV